MFCSIIFFPTILPFMR